MERRAGGSGSASFALRAVTALGGLLDVVAVVGHRERRDRLRKLPRLLWVPKLMERIRILKRLAVAVVAVALVAMLVGNWLIPLPPRVAEPPDAEPPAIAEIYDPVTAGEPVPSGFRQLLARDGIEPIYHPVHVDADEIDWDDDTLVLGVAIDDEARAYPIRTLNRREIVNDRIADTPLLASW